MPENKRSDPVRWIYCRSWKCLPQSVLPSICRGCLRQNRRCRRDYRRYSPECPGCRPDWDRTSGHSGLFYNIYGETYFYNRNPESSRVYRASLLLCLSVASVNMTFHSVSLHPGYPQGSESFRHNIVVRQLVCGNQACNGFCGCQLHFLGDLCGASFQSTLENTGECHNIVHRGKSLQPVPQCTLLLISYWENHPA